MRQMMISEFGDWLRTQTNKQRRPFQEETVQAYTAAAVTLSAWMETEGVSGDFTAYLRARRSHAKAVTTPALWRGTRGPPTGSGVYRMIKLRAEQARYDPTAYPHMFRHTFAHDWLLGGGEEGDLMRLMGWKDRSMLGRYAADMQVQRAIEAKRRRGQIY
jgi:integrase